MVKRLTAQLPLESETYWMVLAGVLDYILTYTLIYLGHYLGVPVREANPLANVFLSQFDEYGLLIFKLALILLIAGIAQVIVVTRPRLAKGCLWFGTVAWALVVAYQLVLLAILSGVYR